MFAAFTSYTGKLLTIERPAQGCNFDVTLLIAERGKFIVKTGDAPWKIAELEREGQILTALAAYQPCIPYYLARVGSDFLFTYVDGINLVAAAHRLEESPYFNPSCDYLSLATQYGKGLRLIHETFQPDLPRPTDWLDEAVAQCTYNVRESKISGVADEHSVHAGRSVEDLLASVVKERPHYQTVLRFSHGDWCMPNVLVENHAFVGAVDWSNGGYKDYRYDLATALWSLRRNSLEGHERFFLKSGYDYNDSLESLDFFEAIYALL